MAMPTFAPPLRTSSATCAAPRPSTRCSAYCRDNNSRAKREAALALARIGKPAATTTKALLELVQHNDDRDAVLRHAAVFALAEVAPKQQLLAKADAPQVAVRRGVLLALARRPRRRDCALSTGRRRAAAATKPRARSYEAPIDAAMSALSKLTYDDKPDSLRVDWRAIQANRMLGETENGESLVHLATQANHPAETRREALAVLAEWIEPHGQCRVNGNWRPSRHPKTYIIQQCVFRLSSNAVRRSGHRQRNR